MLTPLSKSSVDEMSALMPEYATLLSHIRLYEDNTYSSAAVWYKDKLLAIGGLVVCQGVAQTWMVVSEYGLNHPRCLTFAVRRFLRRELRKGRFHRLEARVNVKHEQAAAFVEVLGFVSEGRNRLYYQDGTDAFLYAWTVG